MGLVWWWGWQVVRVQWCLRGLSRVGLASGGLAFAGVGVVAVRIRFLVRAGAALGGRLGSGVGRLVGVAAIPCGDVARAWRAVGR